MSDGIHFALQDMSNAIKRSIVSTYLNVPEPLIASDAVSVTMYPWRTFISKCVGIGNDDSCCVYSILIIQYNTGCYLFVCYCWYYYLYSYSCSNDPNSKILIKTSIKTG